MTTPSPTICAITTPHGISAVGMIKVSGSSAIEIVNKCFAPLSKKCCLIDTKPNSAIYGWLRDPSTGEEIDDVILILYRAPFSYTGEDVIEICSHGSPYILSTILKILLECGAELAMPGEFTRRAVTNGKMDLSQAEAVADVIASTNRAALRLSMTQMRGGFSAKIRALREPLIHFASLLELELDFSEEEVEFAQRTDLIDRCKAIIDELRLLHDSYDTGLIIKEGIPIAIVGSTNAGKSTLLNALLHEDRAIVSDVHGTTRDTIEDTLIINGQQFRLVDTAGLRLTDDVVENIGIQRAYKEMAKAALVLWIIDPHSSNSLPDLYHSINKQRSDSSSLFALINKIDIAEPQRLSELKEELAHLGIETVVTLSAKREQEVEGLKSLISNTFKQYDIDQNSVIISNIRHATAISHAITSLEAVLEGLQAGLSIDLVAQELRSAIRSLGEITGEINSDDLLKNIFQHFCIGK